MVAIVGAVTSPASASTMASSGGAPAARLSTGGSSKSSFPELPSLLRGRHREGLGGPRDGGLAMVAKPSLRARVWGWMRPRRHARTSREHGAKIVAPKNIDECEALPPAETDSPGGGPCGQCSSEARSPECQQRLVDAQIQCSPPEAAKPARVRAALDGLATLASRLCGGCGLAPACPRQHPHHHQAAAPASSQDPPKALARDNSAVLAKHSPVPPWTARDRRRRRSLRVVAPHGPGREDQRSALRRAFLQTTSRGRRLLAAGRSAVF